MSKAQEQTSKSEVTMVQKSYKVNSESTIDVSIWVAFDGNNCVVISDDNYARLSAIPQEQRGLTKFQLSDFQKETASFRHMSFGVNNVITSESLVPNPYSGTATDPALMRMAKLKYLLRSWSIDVPLVIEVFDDIPRLSAVTLMNINEVYPDIIISFISEYDQQFFGV
jgi:hypothetical protein